MLKISNVLYVIYYPQTLFFKKGIRWVRWRWGVLEQGTFQYPTGPTWAESGQSPVLPGPQYPGLLGSYSRNRQISKF